MRCLPTRTTGRCWRPAGAGGGEVVLREGGGGGGWRRVGTAAGTREDVGRQGELRCQGGVGRGGVVGAQKTPQARRHFRRGATMRPTRSRLPLPVPSSPIAAPTPPRCGGLDATHAQLKLRVVLLAYRRWPGRGWLERGSSVPKHSTLPYRQDTRHRGHQRALRDGEGRAGGHRRLGGDGPPSPRHRAQTGLKGVRALGFSGCVGGRGSRLRYYSIAVPDS